jgi:hypothetical protein
MAIRSYTISRSSSSAVNAPAGSLSSRSVITGQQYSSVSERKEADAQARQVAEQALAKGQAPPQPASGGIYTSSLPGSVRSPQANALLQQAQQEKAAGNQQEAAMLERQAAEEQRRVSQQKYIEREASFSQSVAVGQAEPGKLSAISILDTAGERRAAGEIRNIPFQQVEGVTQTKLPAKDFSFVTAASPGFAGKAATIPELNVQTGISAITAGMRPAGRITSVTARSPEVFTQEVPEVQSPQGIVFKEGSLKEPVAPGAEFKSFSEKLLQKSKEATGLKKVALGLIAAPVSIFEPYVYLAREPFIKSTPYKAYQEINTNEGQYSANVKSNIGSVNHKVSSIVEGLKSFGKNLLFEKTYAEYGSLEKTREAPVQAKSFLSARQAAERRLEVSEKKFEASFGRPISEVYAEVKPVYEAARVKETGYTSERAEQFGQEAAFSTAGFALAGPVIGSVSGVTGSILPKAASSVSAKIVGTGIVLTAIEAPNIVAETKEYGLGTALSSSVGRVATYVTVFKGIETIGRVSVVEPSFKESMYSFKFGKEVKGPAETSRYLFTSTKGKPIIAAQISKPIETGPKTVSVKRVTPEAGPRSFNDLFKSRSTPEILEARSKASSDILKASNKELMRNNELIAKDYSKNIDRFTGKAGGEVIKYGGIVASGSKLPSSIKSLVTRPGKVTPIKGGGRDIIPTGDTGLTGKGPSGVYIPEPNEIIVPGKKDIYVPEPNEKIIDRPAEKVDYTPKPNEEIVFPAIGIPGLGRHEPGFGGVPRFGRSGAYGGTKTYKVISPQAYRRILTGSSKSYLKNKMRLY